MISEIARLVFGYLKAEIKGENRKRLINAAVKSGLRFWDYQFGENIIIISLHQNDFKKLQEINKKINAEIKVIKEAGLPFLLRPYKKRLGLILGAVFGLIICILMSDRVWVITSSGSLIYKEEEVIKIAKEIGIDIGALRSDVDPHDAAIKLMRRMEGVDFISVNTNGVWIDIVIKDSTPKPEILEGKAVRNVVAKKDAVIYSVEALDGMAKVKKGEGVKKGDILITGLWDTYDKWGVKTGKSFSAAARGKIIGEVWEDYTFTLKLKDTVYINGASIDKYYMSFFEINFPVTFPMIKNGEYVKEVTENPLYLLGVKMPIILIKETYTEKISTERELTLVEAEKQLNVMLSNEIKEKEKNGSMFLRKEITLEQKNNTLILKARCYFLEDIGEEVEVLFE